MMQSYVQAPVGLLLIGGKDKTRLKLLEEIPGLKFGRPDQWLSGPLTGSQFVMDAAERVAWYETSKADKQVP